MELLKETKKNYKIKPSYVLIAVCQLELFRKTKNIETIYKVCAVLFDCVVPKNLNWKLKLMAFA